MSSGLVHAPADSYPVLPLMFAYAPNSQYGIINQRAANIYQAYMRTWVAGKNLSETDGFELEADADAYWRRLFWGSEVKNNEGDEVGHEIRWKRYRNSAGAGVSPEEVLHHEEGVLWDWAGRDAAG